MRSKHLTAFLFSLLLSKINALCNTHALILRAFNGHRVLNCAPLATSTVFYGPPLPINQEFDGLKQVYTDPDIYILEGFLDKSDCMDMIHQAKNKSLQLSPVAYAGWTRDMQDLLSLAAKGPVSWLAILISWMQMKDNATANTLEFIKHILLNYPLFYLIAAGLVSIYIKTRTSDLQSLRTSTSTTLDNLEDPTSGASKFVVKAAKLFDHFKREDSDQIQKEASHFEAPTIIRYEAGQVLKPHFDANRDADVEDLNRGGQTLATLLLYLNDVEKGGKTRFGRLRLSNSSSEIDSLEITPKMGDALLFFPADKYGKFDERTEHEGCPAIDEKWIARIWRHRSRVQPPYGLSTKSLSKLSS